MIHFGFTLCGLWFCLHLLLASVLFFLPCFNDPATHSSLPSICQLQPTAHPVTLSQTHRFASVLLMGGTLATR